MKYERRFSDIVEAEQIPPDPSFSDIQRLAAFAGAQYSVMPDDNGVPTLVWYVNGRIVYTAPGNWIVKDAENCLSFFESFDFTANFTPVVAETPELAVLG